MSPSALFVTTVPITLEAFLLPFADHFRAMGWRIDALSSGATSNPHLSEHFDHRFDVRWSRKPLDPANLIGTAPHVRAIVRNGGYDIVHVHTPIAAFVTRYALRAVKQPERPAIIYTAHGFHFYAGQSRLPHTLYRTMERAAARWTDYLVTINAEDYAAARELGTIAVERVRLIPGIGVDIERFNPDTSHPERVTTIRSQLDVPPNAFMLTMIAELAPVKRHAHLFEALEKTTNPETVLVLVGDGPLEARLLDHAASLGIAERIRWAGYRGDVPDILAASDAVALVSEREGLPRSVLEAMAAGKPVIGTDTRGIRDAVGSDAGWIAPKDDVVALAAAIDEAAVSASECTKRGVLARERAIREFALPRIIRDYEELYREALASRV